MTLEINEKYAKIAKSNIRHAGLADRVDVRVGPALESLEKMAHEGEMERGGQV